MVQSFYATDYVTGDPCIVNNYNSYEFDDEHILVSTEHGSWVVLSGEEFKLLRLGRVQEDPNLFKELEEKGIILTEGNVQNVVRDYYEKKKFLFSNPNLHIITPTMRCNQRCIYCHSAVKNPQAKGFDLDFDTGKAIVDFILKFPIKNFTIEFQGGDCLLNYGVTEKIIDYAKENAEKVGKKVFFSLVSNLTLLDDSILESLAKRKVRGLATSFDGPREVHDKNRPYLSGAGSYDKVVYWVDRIKTEWKDSFCLNALCTVTRNSFGHESEIVEEYLKRGFNAIWLRPLNNIGFAKSDWRKVGYSVEEYLSFWRKSMDYILKKNHEGNRIIELFSVIFAKKIITKSDPMMVDIMSPCGAAIGQLLYNYKGDIFTCDEGKIFQEFKLGNVKSSSIKDIFLNPTTISMIDISSKKNFLCDRCVWEPYCGFCPIYSYSSEGTIVSKLAMNDRCRIYGAIIKELFKKFIFSPEDRQVLFDWIREEKVFS